MAVPRHVRPPDRATAPHTLLWFVVLGAGGGVLLVTDIAVAIVFVVVYLTTTGVWLVSRQKSSGRDFRQ